MENTIALLLDGASLHAASRKIGLEFDYRLLLDEFRRRGRLIRASYYAVTVHDTEFMVVRRLLDWLAYNGYTVVTKPARESVGASGYRKPNGGIGVELAVDALMLAQYVDQLFLFSGDGDFRSLVAALQRRGVRVTVVSTMTVLADGLRRQADEFMDLIDLRDRIRLARPELRVAGARALDLAAK